MIYASSWENNLYGSYRVLGYCQHLSYCRGHSECHRNTHLTLWTVTELWIFSFQHYLDLMYVIRVMHLAWTTQNTTTMYFQRVEAPTLYRRQWRSAWMTSSLTAGLVVEVRRIGHWGLRTSLPWFMQKNTACEFKQNRRQELHNRVCNAARRINFNHCSSVTVENRTYVRMTFMTENEVRSKNLKYW